MKKTIAIIALSGLLFISCKNRDTVSVRLPNQDGVNISKSANIDLVAKLVDQASKFDLVNFKANFAPNAIIHDNGKTLTLDENIKMLEELKAKGMVFNPGKEPLIWEIVNDKPDPKTGITNYVITYYHSTFTRNGKSVPIIYNMNFAVKDGKVQEEWDTYDSAPIMEILK